MIPRYYVVVESGHVLQNPTSEEKLRRLGALVGLASGTHVLDVASGRGGPAVLLGREFGCTVRGIEVAPEFHAAAVERAAAAGVSERVTFELADARSATLEPHAYDVALCLGASFVYGGLADTVDGVAPAVRPGGYVVVGEPFWRQLPLPEDYEDRADSWTTLEGTVTIFETTGLPVVSVIASSEDDWDCYETLHWHAIETWLPAHPDDPDAPELRARYERDKRTYLRYGRDYLGWAIFVGWKRP